MRKIWELNDFANQCGYFYNAYLEKGISMNNGYNCRHTECEDTEKDEVTGEEIGRSFSFSCPLACEADQEDFNNTEIDNDGWSKCEEGRFVIPYEKVEEL